MVKKKIEEIYKEMDEITHILERPGMWVGSVKEEQKQMFLYNTEAQVMETKDITYIPAMLKVVDEVFKEESLELKAEYIKKFNASVLIMGDDWAGKFDWVKEHCDVEVIYLPRTPSVSTTAIIEKIRS
jgi:glycerol-3-phosphate cytidylyltransferase